MSKKIIILTAILCVIAVSIGTVAAITLNDIFNPHVNIIHDPPKIPEDENKEITKVKNVLVLGTDKSGELADVIIVFRYNPKNNLVSFLSIPRDTRVSYNGQYLKINSLYKIGLSTIIEKVEKITGLYIDNYLVFSTTSFKDVVDILGGVDFDVPVNMKYNDPYQDLHINLKKGMQHLDGNKAEQLVRYRKYTMGDIDRIEVQQNFIKELIKQKLKPSSLTKAPVLIKEILQTVQTDLRLSDLTPYIPNITDLSSIELKSMMLPGVADYVDGISYWLQDQEETSKIIKDFTSDIKKTLVNETNVDDNIELGKTEDTKE